MALRGVDGDLALRLEAIRQEVGDTVKVEHIAEVVQAMLDTVKGDVGASDLKLYREIESLADYIQNAKAEIAALRPGEIKNEFIASATDELDAIVGATESATNEIMDAAEHLESLTPLMDSEVASRLTEITTRIFEACTFQDITGQRITKVVRMLKEIEQRVESLVGAFGGDTSSPAERQEKAITTDEDLLNGPQLPGGAADQAEIDRLLASFD